MRIIVWDFGLSVNGHAQLGRDVPVYKPPACPGCGQPGLLVGHGLRRRTVWLPGGVLLAIFIFVRRLRCPPTRGGCGGVFTVLPAILHPLKRYALQVVQPVLVERFSKGCTYGDLADRFETPAPSTQRSWVAGFEKVAGSWLRQVTHRWARWIPEMTLPRHVESGACWRVPRCAWMMSGPSWGSPPSRSPGSWPASGRGAPIAWIAYCFRLPEAAQARGDGAAILHRRRPLDRQAMEVTIGRKSAAASGPGGAPDASGPVPSFPGRPASVGGVRARRAHPGADGFVWIDDLSRLVPYAEFFLHETLPRMERTLKLAILRRGLPGALYTDNGNVYSATQFLAALAELNVTEIKSQKAYPQGRGKIERIFGVIQDDLYPEIYKSIEEGSLRTLSDLNEALWAWLERIYHQRVHSETKKTPLDAYHDGLGDVRAADPVKVARAFLWRYTRKVSKNGFLSLFGNSYSVDLAWAQQKLELRMDPFDFSRVDVYRDRRPIARAVVRDLKRASYRALDLEPLNAPEPVEPSGVSFLDLLRQEYRRQQAA